MLAAWESLSPTLESLQHHQVTPMFSNLSEFTLYRWNAGLLILVPKAFSIPKCTTPRKLGPPHF